MLIQILIQRSVMMEKDKKHLLLMLMQIGQVIQSLESPLQGIL